jgi:hypothetical protein
MSQENNGVIISCKAADASVTAYKIVAVSGKNTVDLWDTVTSAILGVTTIDAIAAGSAVGVIIGGTARVMCGASVGVGAVVTAQTGTGKCIEAVTTLNTTTTVIPKTLGIALQNGSTNAVIEVSVMPNNIRVAIS